MERLVSCFGCLTLQNKLCFLTWSTTCKVSSNLWILRGFCWRTRKEKRASCAHVSRCGNYSCVLKSLTNYHGSRIASRRCHWHLHSRRSLRVHWATLVLCIVKTNGNNRMCDVWWLYEHRESSDQVWNLSAFLKPCWLYSLLTVRPKSHLSAACCTRYKWTLLEDCFESLTYRLECQLP